MQMTEHNNPTSEQEIQKFGELIHATLPYDYRNFLLKYNGGKPEYYIFPENDNTYQLALDLLHGLNTNNNYSDLKWNYNTYTDRIMDSFIPIADEIGGDQFVLGVKGDFKGKVYLWDHNEELDNDKFQENILPDNMYLLADSFTDFMEQLEEDTEA